MVRFSVSASEAPALIARGFRQVRTYDTVRCGRVTVVETPPGTVQEQEVVPSVRGTGAYSRSARYQYRLASGTGFCAGGGGPSDLDTVRF